VQDRTGVRRAADVEAAPDDQLDVVAPDVHMRSRECSDFPTDSTTDCPTATEVAARERTDT
jgi:hypothetical protein